MGKRRIIVPNPKIEKNDIGKKDKKFNDIYTNNIETVNISTDNINTKKINGEIIDEERYLENQFTIIYPNNGTAESPANITINSKYIFDNPFSDYQINCKAEIFLGGVWFTQKFVAFYNGSDYYSSGFFCEPYKDKIVLITGSYYLTLSDNNDYIYRVYPSIHNLNISATTAPARIKIWKVGKIK